MSECPPQPRTHSMTTAQSSGRALPIDAFGGIEFVPASAEATTRALCVEALESDRALLLPCQEGDPLQDGPWGGGGSGDSFDGGGGAGGTPTSPPVPNGPPVPEKPQPQNYPSEEVTYVAECPEGYDGDPVSVTIPAGAYTSPIPGRATAIALQQAAYQARLQLVCTFGVIEEETIRFCCSVNFNSVATVVTTEDRALLELEAFTDQLDCSELACQAITGSAVEASASFAELCVGGTWYADPAPDIEDRWEVVGPFEGAPDCTPGENTGD